MMDSMGFLRGPSVCSGGFSHVSSFPKGLYRLFIELDDVKIYRKPLYLMVKTMVSCRFSLKPTH